MGKTMTLRLPDDVQNALEDAARRYQWSEDQVICAALRYYLLNEGPPHFKWVGSVSDPTLKAAEVDEWLEARARPK